MLRSKTNSTLASQPRAL